MKRLGLALAIACAGVVATCAACTTLDHHSAEPYRSDAKQAAAIEREAIAWCSAHGEPAGPPTLPFRTDACSLWLDGSWPACCVEHDVAYWCGGTAEARARADAELSACVAREYAPWMGGLMQVGVRVGGSPLWPTYFRWGYGHPYSGRYPHPTAPPGPSQP